MGLLVFAYSTLLILLLLLVPQNKLGDTPLHNAAWKGHAAVVELLLEKGGQIHTQAKTLGSRGECLNHVIVM